MTGVRDLTGAERLRHDGWAQSRSLCRIADKLEGPVDGVISGPTDACVGKRSRGFEPGVTLFTGLFHVPGHRDCAAANREGSTSRTTQRWCAKYVHRGAAWVLDAGARWGAARPDHTNSPADDSKPTTAEGKHDSPLLHSTGLGGRPLSPPQAFGKQTFKGLNPKRVNRPPLLDLVERHA